MIHDEAGAIDLVYLVIIIIFWFKVRSAPPGMLSPFFSSLPVVRWKEEEEEDGLRIVTEGLVHVWKLCRSLCVQVLSQYISCNSLPLELFLRCIQLLNLKAKVTRHPL